VAAKFLGGEHIEAEAIREGGCGRSVADVVLNLSHGNTQPVSDRLVGNATK